jgi:hypothetical protein
MHMFYRELCSHQITKLACHALQEISQFVAANWVQLEDHDTGGNYYYNQITHCSQFDQPIQPHRVRPIQHQL